MNLKLARIWSPLRFVRLAAAIVGAGLVLSCSPESPKLLLKPDYSKPVEKQSLGELVPPPVDILFVIDNSGSMSSHQQNLATNINLFINSFTGKTNIDFHIGVITSDNAEFFGKVKVVTKQDPNFMADLKNNFIVGTGGSSTEVFFDYASKALSPAFLTGVNQGFYREKALLAIVIMTDTEDQGVLSAQDFYKELVNLKRDPRLVAGYGAYISYPANTTCQGESTDTVKLDEFFRITKAITFELCDPNFGLKLAEIGQDIKQKAPQYVMLKQIPVLHTIEVKYGSQVIPNDIDVGWMYDPSNNMLKFGPNLIMTQQPPGTTIEVRFTPADI